ncbi:MAG: (Fe-S)-binding protein [Pseudomonadota bacterium]
MGNINTLAFLVKELEDQLVVCIRCGMCQSVCPVFEQTGREADVARGKLALLNGLMTKLFTDPDGVNDRLNKCLLCGSCAANCPSGVNVLEIFIKARAILTEYKGLSFVKKIIFKQMLSKPKTFDTIMVWAEKFQNLMVKSNTTAQGTSCARFVSPLLKHRHFMPIAKQPFHTSLDTLDLVSQSPGIKVAFFTGCLIDKIMPQIGIALVKVLRHKNVGLFIPDNQGCCGIPALASGDRKTFTALLEHNVKLFLKQDFDYLITACATCTSTIKKLWPSLYQGNDNGLKTIIDDLSKKTMDINQFLIDVIKIKPDVGSNKNQSETITYHDPCHLKKSLGIFTQPRQLITASGHELIEMKDADKCCGMGGSFNLFHYDISTKIGNLKQQNIIETNCSTIASGCPACIMQISDMLSKTGSGIQVKHPIELYADSLQRS